MAPAPNAAFAYTNNKINTAKPEELTLMLYDGAIRFCNQAIMALEKQDIMKANEFIIKVENIIVEFRSTLDFQYPVAEDFEKVYIYLYDSLIEANVKKDIEILKEVLEHLRTLRDTWKEAMTLASGKKG